MPATVRQLGAAVRALVLMTVLLGVLYPLLITGAAQLFFNDKANGSLVELDGRTVGSSLIGQVFEGPEWFQPRPSMAGDGYDPLASGASNLGPENQDLVDAVEERRAAAAQANGIAPSQVPPDAVTASGSGLDPHISPAYARLQVARVAEARGLDSAVVAELVEDHVQGRDLGFLGDPTVNVLQLNLALQQLGS